jgi:arylsulfatase A-like enzyme
MTGQHTGHTRVRGNKGKVGGVPPERRVPLETEDVTVAEVLKARGYVTGITGKWGLGEPETTGVPSRQGFDEWLGYLNQARAHTYYPDYIWRNQEKLELPGNFAGKNEQYTHDMFTQFALDFIRKYHQQPFFLYVPWCIPHDKLEVPSLEPYAGTDWPENAKTYAAMVTRMDTHVGRILNLLKELEIDEKTIVFFCSDNGAARRWEGMFDSSGPLRGHKRDMYEGGIRTPMVVRWPGKIPAGKVSDSVWYFADVLPTFAALSGADAPENIDGINVLPAIIGEDRDYKDRFLYWEFFERGFNQAVRWKDWKAVRKGPDQPIELYDLAVDIGEEKNIADEHPKVVARIEEYLSTARTESKNWPVG